MYYLSKQVHYNHTKTLFPISPLIWDIIRAKIEEDKIILFQ